MPWTELSYLRRPVHSFPTGVLLAERRRVLRGGQPSRVHAARPLACRGDRTAPLATRRRRSSRGGRSAMAGLPARRRTNGRVHDRAPRREVRAPSASTLAPISCRSAQLVHHGRADTRRCSGGRPSGDDHVCLDEEGARRTGVARDRALSRRAVGLRVSHGMAPEVYERLSRGLSAAPPESTGSHSSGESSP